MQWIAGYFNIGYGSVHNDQGVRAGFAVFDRVGPRRQPGFFFPRFEGCPMDDTLVFTFSSSSCKRRGWLLAAFASPQLVKHLTYVRIRMYRPAAKQG